MLLVRFFSAVTAYLSFYPLFEALREAERKVLYAFGEVPCVLQLTISALCRYNGKIISVTCCVNSVGLPVIIPFRETARGTVEGELSGGEQAERRRSGETDGACTIKS